MVLLKQQTATKQRAAARAADIAQGLTLVRRYLGQGARSSAANRAEADLRMAFRLDCQIEALQRLAEDLAAASQDGQAVALPTPDRTPVGDRPIAPNETLGPPSHQR